MVVVSNLAAASRTIAYFPIGLVAVGLVATLSRAGVLMVLGLEQAWSAFAGIYSVALKSLWSGCNFQIED